MRNTLKELTREELETLLLNSTFIEAGDLETAGWVRNPRNMYTAMCGIQKQLKVKL
jgi:hypothetical protein